MAHLRQIDRPKVDVIFLDFNMPRMSGFEFLQIAKAEFGDRLSGTIVIMLTTSLDPDDQAKADTYSFIKAYLARR